jgi:hypothetical protein
MGQQGSSAKSPPKGKSTKSFCLSPSCRELADRFNELQLLRQKVRAAECAQISGQPDELLPV